MSGYVEDLSRSEGVLREWQTVAHFSRKKKEISIDLCRISAYMR